MQSRYDVVVVGGGVIGTALSYVLSNFTDVRSIALIEKRRGLALASSNSGSNSQTLHVGDIETNYSTEKIFETRAASDLVLKYVDTLSAAERRRIVFPVQKMVLGVGDDETELVEERYDEKFLSLFPNIEKIGRDDISRVEPLVTKGRDQHEKIVAAYSKKGNMVDFGRLARSFVRKASLQRGKRVDIRLGERVLQVVPMKGYYDVITEKGICSADFVVFAAGGYSLYFAKQMGYANDLSMLAVGGNFYYTRKKVLKGKVYRVQKGGIPFAAVHGDPDLRHPGRTRFGPTVNVVPYLEKSDPSTAYDYMKAMGLDAEALSSMLKITANKDILEIMAKNLVYSAPDLGKYFFLKEEVNKIVPSLKYGDIRFEKGGGGIRPQIVDKKKGKLVLGVVELEVGGLEFDMDPSPGASSCLREALEDSIKIARYLDKDFHVGKFCETFCKKAESRKSLVGGMRIPESEKRRWVT